MDRFDVDEELQAALDRLTLLTEVGSAMGSTLELHEGLRRAGGVVAGRLGDWCAIDVYTESGQLERIAVTCRAMGAQVFQEDVASPVGDGPLGRVLAGAGPLLLTDTAAEAGAAEDPALALFARLGAHSAVITPLRSRGEVLGALSVARRIADQPLSSQDASLAEQVAARISLGVDNAQLYRASSRIAERLQRSLLPVLPHPEPLALAARYNPAASTAEVGGDWYDAFVLPGVGTALIIGDVVGHDLAAAVAMSQLRNMLRGIACDRQEPPGLILRRLDLANSILYPGTYATCIYALVTTAADGTMRLEHSTAGHPPSLLVTAQGDTRYLSEGHGPLLGVDPHSERPSAVDVLPPGSSVLFYTDGLIERRGESLDQGMTRLRQHAAALARHPVEALCEELLAGLGLNQSDDIALLAVRLPG
jgi:sigma-B regulation protein RsbU (phosphoserine phosphatase)